MQHLQEFIETQCTFDNNASILSSYFWDQYKSYLRVHHAGVSTNFSNKMFTTWMGKLYPQLKNIPKTNGKTFMGVCMNRDHEKFKPRNKYDDIAPEDKKRIYNQNYYDKNRTQIKKKTKAYKEKQRKIKKEYMRLSRLDSSNEADNRIYKQRKKLGLIIIINNDDGSINWPETMKKSNEALRNEQMKRIKGKQLTNQGNKLTTNEKEEIYQAPSEPSGKQEIDQHQLEPSGKKEIDRPQLEPRGKEITDQHQSEPSNKEEMDQLKLNDTTEIDISQSKSPGKEEIDQPQFEPNDKEKIRSKGSTRLRIQRQIGQTKIPSIIINTQQSEPINKPNDLNRVNENNKCDKSDDISLVNNKFFTINRVTCNPIVIREQPKYIPFDRKYEKIDRVEFESINYNTITIEEYKELKKFYLEKYKLIDKYIRKLEMVRDHPHKFNPKEIAGVDAENELSKLEKIDERLHEDWGEIADICDEILDN